MANKIEVSKMGYKIYLKGLGFLKTRYTRKPKIFSTKARAERMAEIERERGWKVTLIRV